MTNYQEFISKPEISFWVPIITSAVLIASSFFILEGKMAVANQKLDNISETLKEMKMAQSDYQHTALAAMNKVESHLCTLDVKHGISCIGN